MAKLSAVCQINVEKTLMQHDEEAAKSSVRPRGDCRAEGAGAPEDAVLRGQCRRRVRRGGRAGGDGGGGDQAHAGEGYGASESNGSRVIKHFK